MNTKKTEKDWIRSLAAGQNASQLAEEEPKKKASAKVEIKQKSCTTKKSKGFEEVAGMDDLKKLVTESFINVLKNRECAEAYGIKPPNFLLYGPSGCGKTYFAESLANELDVAFMKVVPDDIASTLVHGTQQMIGELFKKAEKSAPCILFLDEVDAMCPQRSADDRNYQNGEVNEFLTCLNNSAEKGIYVLAATNHPERIDRAILRTGRIDEIIYVDMPDKQARESLFRLSLSKVPSADNIDYSRLAALSQGYNCSDIRYIVEVACRKMFNESIAEKDKPYKVITQSLLEESIAGRSPSVSSKDLREYERIRCEFSPKDAGVKHQSIGFH